MPLENTDAEERITRETMIGWIEHWGESYDDVRPDDGAMRLANRIIEYNAATETIEALRNPDAVYDELASILQPVLSSMDGTYFAAPNGSPAKWTAWKRTASTGSSRKKRTAWPPKNPASRSSWRARPQPPIRTNRRWTS